MSPTTPSQRRRPERPQRSPGRLVPQTCTPARTSTMFSEVLRCQISDLPYPWCACWVCRPDIPFGADEATDDNTEENL